MAGLITGWAGFAAKAQETLRIGYEAPAQMSSLPLHLRQPGQSDMPTVKAGFQVESFAKVAADIRGLAIAGNGDIFVLDQKLGRISVLSDRDKDGRLDITRKLPAIFDQPVSMTAADEVLYVVDRQAVWAVEDGRKRELASLANISADTQFRPLIRAPQAQYLYLGLSHADGTARVVAIERASGKAFPVAEGKGQIRSMAQSKGTPLWLGSNNALIPVTGQEFDHSLGMTFPEHLTVDQLYLPTSEALTAKGVNRLAGKFLIALGQKDIHADAKIKGRELIALNSAFGQPDGQPQTIAGGYFTNHGRTAFGAPGPLVWDERGLFMADTQSGHIWRISQLVPKIRIVEAPKPPIKFYESDEVKKPKASWGSSIEQASSIVSGSLIASDWEEKKLIPKETLMEKLRKEENGEDEEEDKE